MRTRPNLSGSISITGSLPFRYDARIQWGKAGFGLYDSAGDAVATVWRPEMVVCTSEKWQTGKQASLAEWRLHLRLPPRLQARISLST